jgi:hypothetical protein
MWYEFEDVAQEVTEPVIVHDSPPTDPLGPRAGAPVPDKDALAAARQFWTKVIRCCAEPVSGKKGEFRPQPAEAAERATFRVSVVDYSPSGFLASSRSITDCVRLVTTDPQVLILHRCSPAESGPAQVNGAPAGATWEVLVTTPVPWTAIRSVEVVGYRRTAPAAAAG